MFPSFEPYELDGLRVKSNNRHTVFIDNKPCLSSQSIMFLLIETEFDDGNWKPWEIALLVVGVLLLIAVTVGGAVFAWQKLKPG